MNQHGRILSQRSPHRGWRSASCKFLKAGVEARLVLPFFDHQPYTMCLLQGAFRRVKLEVNAVVQDLTATVRKKMASDGAAKLIEDLQLLRKLGESSHVLQVHFSMLTSLKTVQL